MKATYTLMAVLVSICVVSKTEAVTSDISAAQIAINEEIISLPWNYELKQYPLEQSSSSFNLTKGYSLLLDDAARHYDHAMQGMEENSHTEALVFNHNTGIQLIFNYYPNGHVSLEAWENLDAKVLIQEISENMKKVNTERAKNDLPPLRIGDWLQKPLLNEKNHSVSWVYDVTDGDESTVNAVTIKLGRKGYEKITWLSSFDNYLKSMDEMAFLVNQHEFNEGNRYEDYSTGDQMAAMNIASLVSVTAGGNPQKVGLPAFYARLKILSKQLMVPTLIVLGTVGIFSRRRFIVKNPKFHINLIRSLTILKEKTSNRLIRQEV